jgi:ornithine carbamoyltransferase
MNKIQHLISVNDISNENLKYLINRSIYFSKAKDNIDKTLKNKIVGIYLVGIYFKKTSFNIFARKAI